jgi:hypothetical protein
MPALSSRTTKLVCLSVVALCTFGRSALASQPIEMPIERFVREAPFDGRITKLEEIGNEQPMRSISGPDYRITITKTDGSTIVIPRLPTTTFTAQQLGQSVNQRMMNLPNELDLLWDDHTQWGEAVDGLRIGTKLDPPTRSEFHPGEIAEFVIKYKLDRPLRLPFWGLDIYTELHLISPDGREFVWDPFHEYAAGRQRLSAEEKDWRREEYVSGYRETVRLSKSKGAWIDLKTKRPVELSLAEPGTYRMIAQCTFAAGKEAPANAWRGTVRSGEAIWKMTSLPVAKRQLEMAAEQERLLKKWLDRSADAAPSSSHPDPDEQSLVDALQLTENEGLALRLVEIMKTDPKNADDTYRLLTQRSGTMRDGDAGIDGPYLKELALCMLDVNEGKYEKSQGKKQLSNIDGLQEAVIYLGYHPADKETRQRLIALLKQVAHSFEGQEGGFLERKSSVILRFVWEALDDLGLLNTGMTKEAAVELLGTPHREEKSSMTWVAVRPGFRSPYAGRLTAEMKEDRVVKWQRTPY